MASSPEVIPCPHPRKQRRPLSGRLLSKNASAVALTNSKSSEAINLALNSAIGSKPKRNCFTLLNNHGLRTGVSNADFHKRATASKIG
jgi:hypothetical protein